RGSPGRSRRSPRRICTSSARNSSFSRSRLAIKAQYRNAVASRIRANAELAFHTVRRAARDQVRTAGERRVESGEPESGSWLLTLGSWLLGSATFIGLSETLFEDVAHAANGMDQLPLEGIIHLGAEAADVDIDDVGVAIEVHVPDVLGDESP